MADEAKKRRRVRRSGERISEPPDAEGWSESQKRLKEQEAAEKRAAEEKRAADEKRRQQEAKEAEEKDSISKAKAKYLRFLRARYLRFWCPPALPVQSVAGPPACAGPDIALYANSSARAGTRYHNTSPPSTLHSGTNGR